MLRLLSWAGVLTYKCDCAGVPPGVVDPEDGVPGLDDDLEAGYKMTRLRMAIHPSSVLPSTSWGCDMPCVVL